MSVISQETYRRLAIMQLRGETRFRRESIGDFRDREAGVKEFPDEVEPSIDRVCHLRMAEGPRAAVDEDDQRWGLRRRRAHVEHEGPKPLDMGEDDIPPMAEAVGVCFGV